MKVHRSPAKMIGLAFLSLLMTALALFVGFTGYRKEGAGVFRFSSALSVACFS